MARSAFQSYEESMRLLSAAGSRAGKNPAWTVLYVPYSLDSGGFKLKGSTYLYLNPRPCEA
jgi:hypothetical protein